MTEQQWLASRSALAMLQHLCERCGVARRKNGRRKLRLFACACCRRVWDRLKEERDRQIIEIAENFADGLATQEEVTAARERCLDRTDYIWPASRAAIATTDPQPRTAAKQVMFDVCCAVASHGQGYPERWTAESTAHADVVREIFGNPFHPVRIEPAWRAWNEGTVVRIARAIYDERAFDRMPILADALEDAGCGDPAILSHCRGPGPHYRGCFLLDALLGKE
jgi:hypothetical protein